MVAARSRISSARCFGSADQSVRVEQRSTAANQLQAAEATPSQFKAANFFGAGTCDIVYTVPATKSYVLKQVLFDVWADPSPGGGEFVALYNATPCTNPIALINPGGVNGYVVPFEPGVGIKAGQSVYASTAGSVGADIYILGYLAPKAAAPSTMVIPRPTARGTARAGG
jgi:hypothetical protein